MPKPKEEAEILTQSDSSESSDETMTSSDLKKGEQQDDRMSDIVSPPTTARPRADGEKTVLTKQLENSEASGRPGTTKTKPIPDMKLADDDFPRDPDKDSPDVYVCKIKCCTTMFLYFLNIKY